MTDKDPQNDADEPRRRGRPPLIDEASVVAAARRVVVEEGVSKLTMRRLGAELDMDPMVPYRFFDTKDELLDAILLSILVDATPSPQPDAASAVEMGFRAFRDELVDVPNLVAVVGPRLLRSPAAMRPAAWVVVQLTEAGMSAKDALRWNTVLLSYVVGSITLAADGPAKSPEEDSMPRRLREAMAEAGPIDLAEHFEWGFQRLLERLRSDLGL